MVPPERELITVEQAAETMGRSVSAVRKLKDRGKLTAIPHRINGRLMFKKDVVIATMMALEVPAK
jgi:hypothetical protein